MRIGDKNLLCRERVVEGWTSFWTRTGSPTWILSKLDFRPVVLLTQNILQIDWTPSLKANINRFCIWMTQSQDHKISKHLLLPWPDYFLKATRDRLSSSKVVSDVTSQTLKGDYSLIPQSLICPEPRRKYLARITSGDVHSWRHLRFLRLFRVTANSDKWADLPTRDVCTLIHGYEETPFVSKPRRNSKSRFAFEAVKNRKRKKKQIK